MKKKMDSMKEFKTSYPGVCYIEGTKVTDGKPERIYYIRYRKGKKQIKEPVGRQYQHAMTPAKAADIRSDRMRGKEPSNKEKRAEETAKKLAEQNKWTIERLWKDYKQSRTKNKGLSVDDNRFTNYIQPAFGDKEPHELHSFQVTKLRNRLEKKLAPQTVKHILLLLQRIINYGVEQQLCGMLSFKIKMPRVDNEKTEDLTDEQLRRLWKAIEEDDNIQAKNFIKMVLFTGMRRGELFKLKWSDIDFERGFIWIEDPKGGKSQKIPLNNDSRELLFSHERLFPGSPFVFPGKDGGQRVEIKKPINRIKERAGLPKEFRPLHGLRHVFASTLANSGQVDMYQLQKLLTHKNPKMTQRYAHLRDEALKQASEVAGAIIRNINNGEQEQKVVNMEDRKK